MRPLVLDSRGRRVRRRPPARGAVARGVVARRRRGRHGQPDRRRHPLRCRAALERDGDVPRLPDGRRRGRHAPLHGAVRPDPAVAVDEAHRRARADRRAARPPRRPVRRAGRRPLDPRARGAARRLPRRRDARPRGRRLRRRRGRRRARGAVAPLATAARTGRRSVNVDVRRRPSHRAAPPAGCATTASAPSASTRRPRERLLDTFALDPHVAPASMVAERRHAQHRVERRAPQRLLARSPAGALPVPSCAASRRSAAPPLGCRAGRGVARGRLRRGHGDRRGLRQFVDTVWTDGVAFVRDAPTNEDALRALARRVGHIRATNFGPDFHVEAMVDPNNVAYTSVELRPHTDLVNHEHPPGIQFLHCFVADAPGGESTLADGFWIADRVREEAPDDFRLLCEVPHPVPLPRRRQRPALRRPRHRPRRRRRATGRSASTTP